MALRQFDTKDLESIIADNRKSETQKMETIAANNLAEAIREFTRSMPDYISELKAVAPKQDAKKFSDEINSVFMVAARRAAEIFSMRIKASAERVEKHDRIEIPLTAFYIMMITLAYLLIFFGMVIYGNSVAIHSDELLSCIFGILFLWIISLAAFFIIRKYSKT